jgi:hypothetical protein
VNQQQPEPITYSYQPPESYDPTPKPSCNNFAEPNPNYLLASSKPPFDFASISYQQSAEYSSPSNRYESNNGSSNNGKNDSNMSNLSYGNYSGVSFGNSYHPAELLRRDISKQSEPVERKPLSDYELMKQKLFSIEKRKKSISEITVFFFSVVAVANS